MVDRRAFIVAVYLLFIEYRFYFFKEVKTHLETFAVW